MEHHTELLTAIQTCQYHAKDATTILKLKEPSQTGHNHHEASKSRQNTKNRTNCHARTYHCYLESTRTTHTVQDHKKLYKTYNNYAKAATTILNWHKPF